MYIYIYLYIYIYIKFSETLSPFLVFFASNFVSVFEDTINKVSQKGIERAF